MAGFKQEQCTSALECKSLFVLQQNSNIYGYRNIYDLWGICDANLFVENLSKYANIVCDFVYIVGH